MGTQTIRGSPITVIPAQAGTQNNLVWVPACAGMTINLFSRLEKLSMNQPAVYILASQRNGTLYIGVTSDLAQRIWQHRNGAIEGFTKEFGIKILVYWELHEEMESAILREKQLKKWNRSWKLRLIEEKNPEWEDLYESIF